ncbi:MAG: penicillin-binding protein 2 [Patescibacteria group bacterium]
MRDPFYIPEEENKKNFLKNYYKDNEIEPGQALLKGEALRLSINEKIMKFFLFLFFLFIFFIFLRLFILQVIEGNVWLKIAEGRELKIEEIQANRGIIYDRNMQPLVKNIPKFSLYINYRNLPQDKKEREIIFEKLKKIIKNGSFPQDFKNNSQDLFLVKKNLSLEEILLFEIEKDSLPGVILEKKIGREYLAGKEFSHLLGYIGKVSEEEVKKGFSISEEIGKTGLEKYYEEYLRGKNGKKRIEPGGRVVAFEPPQDGYNLILTIDIDLQKKLSEALEKWIKISGAKKGAAVVLSAKNGEVLALVSFPFFDNNLFSQGISSEELNKILLNPNQPLFFRTINGEYPPGSTIKPVLALAGLEEGVIDEKTIFFSQGGVKVGNWFFPDWKKGGHGKTDVRKGLAESVNTFFYHLGQLLGPEKISFYLKKFGLNEKTNIDLPYEKEGFVPDPDWKKREKNEDWFIGDTYNLSIGHGDIRVTPLQIAKLTLIFANRGKIFPLRIVKKIFNLEKSITFEEKFSKLPFKEENFEIVNEGLRQTVTSGTARFLNNFPLAVAGKTGTAESGKEKPHSWFTCFVPFKEPEIIVTVLIENGGEGSGPALRTTKEVLEWWYEHRYKAIK